MNLHRGVGKGNCARILMRRREQVDKRDQGSEVLGVKKDGPGMKTLDTKRRTLEGIKPFRLVKYLSLSSLMVILACTFILSGLISQWAKAILLHKSEQYALLVAENLNHQVFLPVYAPDAHRGR